METQKTKRECQRWSTARRDARRRRPGKQPTSDETKAAVLEMMSRGVNTREIARTLHVGSHAIADVRRANGFKQRAQRRRPGKQPTSDETKAEVLEMMSRGVNTREIARTLHVGSHAIADVRRANGFKQRAQRQTPAPRPVPETIAAMQREQEHLLKLMASAATSALYQELARQYSVLQMKIDYAATMASAADRHDAANHQCGVPMMFKVANGNGFRHH